WLERTQRLDGLGHGIWDVVEFQVQKDRQPDVGEVHHPGPAVVAEELEPKLYPCGMAADRLRQCSGAIEVRRVDRDIDRAAHGTLSSTGYAWFAGRVSVCARRSRHIRARQSIEQGR